MTETALTILAVFAHPDDEIGVGSTLARYSDAGVRTVLACASRGEAATIYCDDCATKETLAEVRTRELECACDHLGIAELRWLDWPDGGIRDLPREQVIGQIVRLIREVRPFVILTHPENGLYPHPDHLAVFEIVRDAFNLSVDPRQVADSGAPWGATRLFTRAMPQSFFERAPGLADFRVQLNGELLPFMSTPDNKIDVTMRVGKWVERRMAAWECHRSQHNPEGFSSVMPDGMRQEMAEIEHFLLAASRLPLPEGVHDDLLAGLWREAPASQKVVRDDSASDGSETAAGSAEPSERFVRQMEAELAAHLAYIEVLKTYARDTQENKAVPVYRELSEGEQEFVHRLARILRQTGGSPGKLVAEERIINHARKHERMDQRFPYLRDQYAGIKSRLGARVAETTVAEERELWEELALLVRSQLETLADL